MISDHLSSSGQLTVGHSNVQLWDSRLFTCTSQNRVGWIADTKISYLYMSLGVGIRRVGPYGITGCHLTNIKSPRRVIDDLGLSLCFELLEYAIIAKTSDLKARRAGHVISQHFLVATGLRVATPTGNWFLPANSDNDA